jgi:hypothetical protein
MPTIEDYTDPEKLKTMMANAKRVGNDEIWRRAFRRLCALEGLNQADPLHRDFYETRLMSNYLPKKMGVPPKRAAPGRN